ncbi:MAG: 30S ribosomal protein S2 [Candidatus Marinamargulisbacteria bacterium]|jgi:small subunit ribosomal protein S2|nr:30S ribosomal protein S2 [bacterium]MDG2265278.1 30S ribosomal protein S2 [Candidatus Marinamargulisbacteria bacterium]|tara:strand:- start:12340 stop:13101 length:762 start_codon:yes stop_codon:yes gene_type:complete
MENEKKKAKIIDLRQLLETGAHFGHQTNRWDPRMKPYIFTARNDIHVIDLQKTIKLIRKAYRFCEALSAKNGTVLFVGTKKQAQDPIEQSALLCGMPYINKRWLGGVLTNNETLQSSISTLIKLEQMQEDGILDSLPNKEKAQKTRKLEKLQGYLSGIKHMRGLPDAIVVVDVVAEELAVKEAVKLGIPVIGIVDTNANPKLVTYPIPANDDAVKSIKLILNTLANGIREGQLQQYSGVETQTKQEAEVVNIK